MNALTPENPAFSVSSVSSVVRTEAFKIIALETNVLARLVTNDDPVKDRLSAALIDTGNALFVPLTVMLELEWVLRGAYALDKLGIVRSFEGGCCQ